MTEKTKPKPKPTDKGNGSPHRGRGRPTRLNQEVIDTVVKALKNGNYLHNACDLAGISVQDKDNWLNRGEADFNAGNAKTIFAEFFVACKNARAFAFDRCSKIIVSAGTPQKVVTRTVKRYRNGASEEHTTEKLEYDWRAAAWWLERSSPRDWGAHAAGERPEDGDGDVPKLIKLGYDWDKHKHDNDPSTAPPLLVAGANEDSASKG